VLKGRKGWLCLALPAAKGHGWLGRLLMHSSTPLMARGASWMPHVCRGDDFLQSGILGTQRENKNTLCKGSREDREI